MNIDHTSLQAPTSSMKSRLAGLLARRITRIFVAVLAIGAAAYFGWDWLAAAGLTAFIVGLLPCAVMCGAGLCASRLFGKKASCHAASSSAPTEVGKAAPLPVLPAAADPGAYKGCR